ncbi:UPF0231 protein [Salmonella enterica subsp. enterica serovar Choleraesuis]|nr:UPF0231 protein [Salmonella enterica subsp. enterica serovar Choleraesuis]
MEHEFLRDITGTVKVRLSMGHEAVGQWINEEAAGNPELLTQVEQAIASVRGSERQWQHIGHEYTIMVDKDEVMVRANQLAFENDELEEGMFYYDEESLAMCGTDDFLSLIASYREFIAGK